MSLWVEKRDRGCKRSKTKKMTSKEKENSRGD